MAFWHFPLSPEQISNVRPPSPQTLQYGRGDLPMLQKLSEFYVTKLIDEVNDIHNISIRRHKGYLPLVGRHLCHWFEWDVRGHRLEEVFL